jgi:hypothetical protein
MQAFFFYQATRGELTALSAADIRGIQKNGNKGLLDLLLFKRTVQAAALAKGGNMFAHSPSAVKLIRTVVRVKTADYSVWAKADAGKKDLAWREGRSPAEIQWLKLFVELTFRKGFDDPLKLALLAGQSGEGALVREGISHAWDNLQEKVDGEKPQDEPQKPEDPEGEQKQPLPDSDAAYNLQFQIETGNDGKLEKGTERGTKRTVSVADLDESAQEQVQAIIDSARSQMGAQVQLIPLDLPEGPRTPENLTDTVRKSCSGKIKNMDETEGRYVGIIFDHKLSGEAAHRPAIRQPPFRKAGFEMRMKACLARSKTANPPEQDAYFLFDGGKEGLHNELLKPFSGMQKCVKQYTVIKGGGQHLQAVREDPGNSRVVAR